MRRCRVIRSNLFRLGIIGFCFLFICFQGVLFAQRSAERVTKHRPTIAGVHGLVTTGGHSLASMAGLQMLMKGGTAADAAVAIQATLTLVEPMMSSIGGNGFMTIFEKATGKVYSLNMTGAAPKALDRESMTAETLNKGVRAGIVPGIFGGLISVLDRMGKLSLAEVFEPAIGYAENGYPIDPATVAYIQSQEEVLRQHPTSVKAMFPKGRVPRAGEMFTWPDLAGTLKKLVEAEQSALKIGKSREEALQAAFDRFYKGDIAQEFDRFFKENDGFITAEDLAAYEPIWAEPVHTTFRGYDIFSSPSTSRGGLETLMQLNLVESYDLDAMGQNSAETLHLLAEAIKITKSDIYHYTADPKFTDMPVRGMLSKEYAKTRRTLIDMNRVISYPEHGNPEKFSPEAESSTVVSAKKSSWEAPLGEEVDEGHTTSFSVVDQYGNAIACTPTLGGGFGSAVATGSTGVFLNNGIRLGSTSPYPDNVNYAKPGQIPILNNSPIIVLKEGKLVLALGTPGGETIGQTQFQVLLNILEFGMDIQEAIEAPRFRLYAEPNFYKPGSRVSMRLEDSLSIETIDRLKAMGHGIELIPPFTGGSSMQGILINAEYGTMTAGADPRRTGYAIGW